MPRLHGVAPGDAKSRRAALLWTCAALGLYAAALGLTHAWTGLWLMPMGALPVALAAWLTGSAGGLIAASMLAVLDAALVTAAGGLPPGMLAESLVGHALSFFVAYGIGFARERLHAQHRLQAQGERRYALAAQSATDGLWDWNLNTGVVHYSESFARLLGEPPSALQGRPEAWLGRVHPEDRPTVEAQLDLHLSGDIDRFVCEHRLRRADGSFAWVLASAVAGTPSSGGERRVTGWLSDIGDRKRTEERLLRHAFYDALTDLPNRALFMDRLAGAIARSRRSEGERFALVLLDLDRFKVVNDSLGHIAGDELLRSVARRLCTCVRPGDTVARLGGDEFMVLLEEVGSVDEALRVAERMQQAIATPLPLLGHEVVTTASLGVAVGDRHTESPHDLLRDADTAMHEAKNQGRGRHALFDDGMHVRAVARLSMESALREAVERQQMRVFYQPIVDLASGRVVGFEALARWEHPERGLVSPMHFIPLAEETGVISDIGQWILLAACSQLRAWQVRFPRQPDLRVSVNLSVRQMHSVDIADRVRGALETTRLPPASLAMEVTESVFLDHESADPGLLESIRRQGVKVYMDDFGTGYSSLGYLQQFRVDALKIDGSFVRDLPQAGEARSLVRSIVTLAKSLRLKVVAEGVETLEQLACLRELGCDEAQGFLFARPGSAEEMQALLEGDERW